MDKWKWDSGHPVHFLNWGHNEPSGDGICTEFISDLWNDLPCDLTRSTFCEIVLSEQKDDNRPPL